MARRGDIAGLAALAALGYGILQSKKNKGKEGASSKDGDIDRETARGARGPVAIEDVDPDLMREIARGGRGPVAVEEPAPAVVKPARAPKASTTMADEDMAREVARGRRGQVGIDQRRADMRGTSEAEAMAANYKPRRYPEATPRKYTRDEMISQIPGSSPEGWKGGSGERVSGSELGRNVSNTMMALGATPLPGAVATGLAEAAAISRANRIARAAKEAEREAVANPLNWMSGPRGELGKRALSEADTTGGAVGFKRGGQIKAKPKMESKPAAKGWGKARGARQAKIY